MTEAVEPKPEDIEVLPGQDCPMCQKKTLELTQMKRDIPFFGEVFVFSMLCSDCKYHVSDLETPSSGNPVKVSFTVESEDDMKVRVIKSAQATLKLPRIMSIEPGAAAQGYITNIEGIFRRVKYAIETARDNAEDNEERKKAKNLLKKIQKIMWGQEKLTITIDDPSGNSAIVSDKAEVKKGKK